MKSNKIVLKYYNKFYIPYELRVEKIPHIPMPGIVKNHTWKTFLMSRRKCYGLGNYEIRKGAYIMNLTISLNSCKY